MDLFGKKAAKRVQELEALLSEAQSKLDSLGYDEYTEGKSILADTNKKIAENNVTIARLQAEVETLKQQEDRLSKQNKTASNRLSKSKELYKSVEYAVTHFFETSPELDQCKLPA